MKKRRKKIWLSILIVFLILMGAAGVLGYKYYSYIYNPNFVCNEEEYYLYIPSDSNFEDLMEILQTNECLLDIESFKWVADKKKYPEKLKPGKYKLTNGMNNND